MPAIRSVALVAGLCLGAGTIATARQTRPLQPLSGTTEAEIVAAAEREGAALGPGDAPPARLHVSFRENMTPGSAARRCVAATGHGPVRSGEFVIGGLLDEPRDRTNELKIWWKPLHAAAEMSLQVRGRRVGSGETTGFRSSAVAWPIPGPGVKVPVELRDYFFPSGTPFPEAGRWVVVATQRSDWGCFILDVK